MSRKLDVTYLTKGELELLFFLWMIDPDSVGLQEITIQYVDIKYKTERFFSLGIIQNLIWKEYAKEAAFSVNMMDGSRGPSTYQITEKGKQRLQDPASMFTRDVMSK